MSDENVRTMDEPDTSARDPAGLRGNASRHATRGWRRYAVFDVRSRNRRARADPTDLAPRIRPHGRARDVRGREARAVARGARHDEPAEVAARDRRRVVHGEP